MKNEGKDKIFTFWDYSIFLGDYEKDADAQSGKLSVLTEHSEENLTEYQRTIQSLKQQRQLIKDLDEARRQIMEKGKIDEDHEDQEKIGNGTAWKYSDRSQTNCSCELFKIWN